MATKTKTGNQLLYPVFLKTIKLLYTERALKKCLYR